TGLPPERNILSLYNINAYMSKIGQFKARWIGFLKMNTGYWIDRLREAVEGLINRIELLFFLLFIIIVDSNFSIDRKSTRLNSSHVKISYAVFCLKKKKNNE